LLRSQVGHLGDDIVVHGSRARGTAAAASDLDVAIRIPLEQFATLLEGRFGTPNPGSAKFRTKQHAMATGKIQAGEAGLRRVRRQLQRQLGLDVDLSVIRQGGPFDQGPFIPMPEEQS
jgi:predicted nucleotidyltransferase